MVAGMAPTTRTKSVPLSELGAPGIMSGLGGWLDTWETTPEMMWPHNVHVFNRMRNDAHIESGLDAMHLPVERSHWDFEPDNDVRPEVLAMCRGDLGIPEKGKRLRRPRGAIKFKDVLRHAQLRDVFGHMVFEQVYDIIDGRARLQKLAPRMPLTITGWDLDDHGGLQGVDQLVPRRNGVWETVHLPIDRIVVFTRGKEGSDPSGRSILRSCYGNWLVKSGLVKVDAIAGERNGMGVPVLEYDPNKIDEKQALDLAKRLRAGEDAGAALEMGAAKLTLAGVEGQVRDILASIRYHDQEISRRMLAMFLDLGHDNGARALGETFVDFFVMALQSAADDIADVLNEHVIRDLVELNYGPDEPYPILKCDEITADSDLTAEALKQLAEAGYLTPDDGLEDQFRNRYGLVPRSASRPAPVAVDEETTDGTIEDLETKLALLKAGPRGRRTAVESVR